MPKPDKNLAKIDMVKAVAGVSFATLAAIGGASGNPMVAGLATLPAAGLASYDILGDQLINLKSQKEKYLELPPPHWWTHDARSWQELCVEIENLIPRILQAIQERMQKEQQVITKDVVRQIFIEALAAQHLPWQPGFEQKRLIGEFIATPILQKLDEILKPVIEQIQQEGMLIDHRKTALHTEQTVQVLEKIHQGMSKAKKVQVLSQEEIASLRKQYCEVLYNRWKMLDFKGIMHIDMNRPISIPLTEVFVFPDVLPGAPEYETLERDVEHSFNSYVSRSEQKIRRTEKQREVLHSVLEKNRRLVLLGDPGSGKSTLLRYLLLQLVQGSDTFVRNFPKMSDSAASVPLYVPLAAYAETLRSSIPGTRSLEDFLPIFLRDNYLDTYTAFIQKQLQQGSLILLFDGLDEIPDAALRMNVISHVEMFTQFHSTNRFIVTSRIIGYKEAPLSAEYQVYTLADFNEEQIKTFTQQWCPAYEHWAMETEGQSLENVAAEEAEKLFSATQSKPGVKGLAVNPLLLTILALIQRQGIELPSHRVELYDLCAMTLIDTWVKAKGQSIHFSKNDLIKILRPLAFWMHQHPAVGAIPEEELHEQIVQQLMARGISEFDATKLAEEFLQTARGQAGILVERGKKRYGFLHLTFEEYFAARELEKRKDRGMFIKGHLHDPRWHEVILLTVGAIGILQSNEEEVTGLVQDIIARAGSPYEWILHRDLLFAGQCLADDVGVSIVCENQIIEQIVYHYLTSSYNQLRTMFSSVLAQWGSIKAGEKAVNLVLPLLQQWVTDTEKMTLPTTSHFEKLIGEHSEKLTREYRGVAMRRLRFHLTIILAHLQALNGLDWTESLLEILSEKRMREKVSSVLEQRKGDLALTEALLLSLTDPDPGVRSTILGALGQFGDIQPRVIDAVLMSLSDPWDEVEKMAIKSLGRLGKGQPGIVDTLLLVFDDFTALLELRLNALWHLDAEHPHVKDAMLLALVDIDSRTARQAGTPVLQHLNNGEQDVSDILFSIISNPGSEVKGTLAYILGQLSSRPAPVIDTFLSSFDNSANAMEVAVRALGLLGKGRPHFTETLLNLTSNSNDNIREAAIGALGYHGDGAPRVIHTLLTSITDSEPLIRREAIRALERLGKSQSHIIDALLPLLTDTNSSVREAVVHSLGQLDTGQSHVIDALLITLSDDDYDVRQAASDAIEYLIRKHPFIINHLVSALSNISNEIRVKRAVDNYRYRLYDHFVERALNLLRAVQSNRSHVINLLFTALPSTNASIRREAARALGQLSKKESHVTENLLKALSSSNWSVRDSATQAFRQLNKGPSNIIDGLLSVLVDSNLTTRANAALTLGEIGKGDPRVIDALLQALSDPESGYVRRCAAIALGQLEESQPYIIDALLHVLFSSSLAGREGAAMALGKIGTDNAYIIDILLSTLASADLSIRGLAAFTFGQISNGEPGVINALLPLIDNPCWFIRMTGVGALGSIKSEQPQVIEAMLPLLFDSCPSVRRTAAGAFAAIFADNANTDTHIIDVLCQCLTDSDWIVREIAARALASVTPRHECGTTGVHLEELLREYEPIVRRELFSYGNAFSALQTIAEKA